MKVTVVATESGEVVASTQAHQEDRPTRGESQGPIAFATLMANSGQTIHELMVPDDLAKLDAPEFHARLSQHLP